MTNKLQEAGNKVRERILSLADSEDIFDYGALDMIEETVREVCSEYARSKVPEKVEDFSNEDSYADIYTGHNECIDVFISSIDQDLQSLNKK